MACLDDKIWAMVTAHEETELDAPAAADAIAAFEAGHDRPLVCSEFARDFVEFVRRVTAEREVPPDWARV